MKKKLIFGISCLFFFPSIVLAAPSYSVSSNASEIETGSKVTFSVTLKNVAAWNIKGNGTGAVSNCKLSESDATSDAKNTTKTFRVSCPTSGTGIVNFELTGDVTDASGSNVKISKDVRVKVIPVRPKSKNNNLKSIGVEGYTLTPEFHKDTLEYSVSVPSTIEKVTLTASKEDSTATINGLGEKEVVEGNNVFDIVVTSQSGSEKTYKVNVIVEDQNPITIHIDGKAYTIIKNVKTIEVPELFTASTIKVQDTDVPSFYHELTNITLIAVKDETGKVFYAVCHEDKTYSLYQPLKSYGVQLLVLEPMNILNGFEKSAIEINNVSVTALVHGNIKVIYAKNLETNEDDYYLYDDKHMTYARYQNDMIDELLEKNELMNYILIGLSAGMGFIFLILLISLCKKKPKQKVVRKEDKAEPVQKEEIKKEEPTSKKKDNKKKKEEKQEDNPKEIVQEEKQEKEEQPKIIATPEEMEEEFYSILDDKPMKRPKK